MKKIFNFFVVLMFLLIASFTAFDRAYALSVTVTSSPQTIEYGTWTTIYWSTIDADSCNLKRYNTVNNQLVTDFGSVSTQNLGGQATSSLYEDTTYVVDCTGPDSYIWCTVLYYPSCFTENTTVILSNGMKKDIQDVKVGDILKGEKTNNKVLGVHKPKLMGKLLYSFNGGRYFVTEEHPFKTIDGWKSINPKKTALQNLGITVTPLNVGDTLITENGLVKINTIDSKYGSYDADLYNFYVDGDHTYYADGHLVHNKPQCDPSVGNNCLNSILCIGGNGMPTEGAGQCGYSCSASVTCTSGKSFCNGNTLACVSPANCNAIPAN